MRPRGRGKGRARGRGKGRGRARGRGHGRGCAARRDPNKLIVTASFPLIDFVSAAQCNMAPVMRISCVKPRPVPSTAVQKNILVRGTSLSK